jgi:hypothetical protein
MSKKERHVSAQNSASCLLHKHRICCTGLVILLYRQAAGASALTETDRKIKAVLFERGFERLHK